MVTPKPQEQKSRDDFHYCPILYVDFVLSHCILAFSASQGRVTCESLNALPPRGQQTLVPLGPKSKGISEGLNLIEFGLGSNPWTVNNVVPVLILKQRGQLYLKMRHCFRSRVNSFLGLSQQIPANSGVKQQKCIISLFQRAEIRQEGIGKATLPSACPRRGSFMPLPGSGCSY
jgi:hypothetical protein